MAGQRFHVPRLTAYAFLLSVVVGVVGVAGAALAWSIFYSAGVFADLQEFISRAPGYSTFDVYSLLGLEPVLAAAVITALVGIVALPLAAAFFGLVYNSTTRLIGAPLRSRGGAPS